MAENAPDNQDNHTLHLSADGNDILHLNDVIGESIAIIGLKGSGKSTSATVFIEEIMDVGNIPITIIDVAGEYYGLKERYPIAVVGHEANENVEIPIQTGEQAAAVAAFSITNGCSFILDLRRYKNIPQRFEIVKAYLETLWDLSADLRRPYMIVLEEAHNFIPQTVVTPVSDLIKIMTSEGRKQGLGFVMITQRAAKIDKTALSNVGIYLFHKAIIAPDVATIHDNLYCDSKKTVKKALFNLRPGQALFFSPSIYRLHHLFQEDNPYVMTVRNQHSYHAGYTPTIGNQPSYALQKTIDQDLLALLRSEVENHTPEHAKVDNDSQPHRNGRNNNNGNNGNNRGYQPREIVEKHDQLTIVVPVLPPVLPFETKQQPIMDGVATGTSATIQTEDITEDKTSDINHHLEIIDEDLKPIVDLRKKKDIFRDLSDGDQIIQKRQMDRFRKFCRNFKDDTNVLHRSIIQFLSDDENLFFSHYDISRGTGYSLNTVRTHFEYELVKRFVQYRKMGRNPILYRSILREYLNIHYHLLDMDEMIHSLLK